MNVGRLTNNGAPQISFRDKVGQPLNFKDIVVVSSKHDSTIDIKKIVRINTSGVWLDEVNAFEGSAGDLYQHQEMVKIGKHLVGL